MQIPIKISILGGLLIAASTASAGLVYDAAILAPAQGFGTAPRVLTLQGSGTTESGGVGALRSRISGRNNIYGSAVELGRHL